ncbi:hypothetical protein [Streptomyces sp. CBMA156]|uniref:hypothetical protein n=1 Tax=Streptomyces sp. CBMA156 TaxID=1930280 RepID=UPI001662163C|nr:hypothetical protein [Streptomyces sp. CBMA156]MBD0673754.1 hypothetical protein [Streptomyces sp. CBMA156]
MRNGTDPDGVGADMADGKDVWVGLGLAEAAAGARIGQAPVADIVAGGRRLRQRRRTVVGTLALASVMALSVGAVAQLRPDRAPAREIGPAGVGAVLQPAASATPTASAVRDPFVPVRVLLGQGSTPDGKQWQLWEALWPVAPKERAFEQATAVWEERSKYDSAVSKPTEEFVQRYWQPDSDVTNVYFTVDGVRLSHDSAGAQAAPGKLDPRNRTLFGGGLVGHRGKGDTVAPLDVVLISLGPDVGRVLVTWADGSTTEPPFVTVADSPIREMVVARPGTLRATSWQFFDKDGTKLPDAGAKYLTEPVS